jgi:hypothetical protein
MLMSFSLEKSNFRSVYHTTFYFRLLLFMVSRKLPEALWHRESLGAHLIHYWNEQYIIDTHFLTKKTVSYGKG